MKLSRAFGALPGEDPQPISEKESARYRDHGRVWSAPRTLGPEKVREAVRHGMEEEAGILLVWDRGHAVTVIETDAVPERDQSELRRMNTGSHPARFWGRVREVMNRSPRPNWEAMTKAVGQITEAPYTVDQLQALVREAPLEGRPVHELRFVGPVNLVELHRSHLFRMHSTQPRCWNGDPVLKRRGWQGRACVSLSVSVAPGMVGFLIPRARQIALAFADIHMVSLAFQPVARVGPTLAFLDQEGVRRTGVKYEIMFPLTGGLASWSEALI